VIVIVARDQKRFGSTSFWAPQGIKHATGVKGETLMKRPFLIFIVIWLTWLMSHEVSAQSYNRVSEKNIKVARGKKLVLTGAVRDGDEVVYRFRASAGQKVTIKIIGRDADFSVSLNYGLDVETVANDTKSWSGTMPREFDGHCEIGVHSTYKVADYRLEILLK
jgi:hypothetical protein